MKKSIFIFALFLLGINYTKAQTLLYSENFSGTVNNVATLNNTWGFSSATANTMTGSSGGRYITTSTYTTTTNTTLILNNINTVGYSDIKISWNGRRATNTPVVTLAYSLNGLNYTTVTGFTDVTANGTWAAINGGATISLPVQAANANQLSLRWTVQVTTNRSYFIDDIKITGTPDEGISTQNWAARPNNEDPFVISSPTSATPYTNDGVTMRMTKQSTTGVNLTTALLSDATFQSPTRSLTLIQNGATATNGSVITTTFNKAVSDLTFTMFDVDRNAGQYRDAIKIEGFKSGVLVPLQKTDVITTSFNEFVEGSNLVQAVATGTDAATNSTNGNVSVRFSGAVDKVVFTYNNLDAASGNQGIGINSFNWKTVPTPLPVTLTAFNGKLVNEQTVLKWATATEKNNEKFIVERSLDGRTFEAIGTVKGNGTTSTAKQYIFTDAKPAQGNNYYRLKQTDFDGAFEYSKLVVVNNTARTEADLHIYPNPATTQITVSLPETAGLENVKIFTLAGNLVKEITLKNQASLQLTIPVTELATGYYLVQVNGNQTFITKKIVKQ